MLRVDKTAGFFTVSGTIGSDDNVIEVEHSDAAPGKLGEEAYDSIRCASTLSFRLADGPQGPRMPTAATPRRP